MTQPHLKQLAQQGNVNAIATLINRALQPNGITAKVQRQESCLQVMLESTPIPDQQFCVPWITAWIQCLAIPSIQFLRIYGRQEGDDFPAWIEDVELNSFSPIIAAPRESILPEKANSSIHRLSFPKNNSYQLKIDLIKTGFISVLAIYGFFGLLNYENLWFIHGFDLIIHEAGHVIFMIFGDFIHALGGTLLQLLVPIGITGYFFYYEQPYSSSVTLFWTAINLFDISRYMKDARAQELPLLGGELVTHDWNYLFGQLNLLDYDQLIGGFVHFLGFLLYVLAIASGFYFACHTKKHSKR
ncbi:MAG TPA: hypothetical protein V6D33_06190 [Cyanophyceae cyanobacterium]